MTASHDGCKITYVIKFGFEPKKDGEFMARQETITHDLILDAAFAMTREEGIENVTARKLAAKAGCSTQPIFRLYSNMEELWQELFDKGIAYFEEFYEEEPKRETTPFVNLGIAYIRFAMREKQLFRMLFLSENRYGKSLYEILNGNKGYLGKEIALAQSEGCKNASELFMKMWIFIHGAACMAITGDYDLEMKETVTLLKDAYQSFAAL